MLFPSHETLHLGWSSHVLLGGTSREFQNSRVTRMPKSILAKRKHHALLLLPPQQFPQMAAQLQERLCIFRAAYVFYHTMILCLMENNYFFVTSMLGFWLFALGKKNSKPACTWEPQQLPDWESGQPRVKYCLFFSRPKGAAFTEGQP